MASAQPNIAALVGPRGPDAVDPRLQINLPDFRLSEGDLRLAGEARRSGLIGAMEVGNGVRIGIGRFAVSEIARPRTHMESERHPGAVRARERGIAAIGISIRY